MMKTLKPISILFFLIACNNMEDSNLNKRLESNVDCSGVYVIPPPTGSGTGVCMAKLIVINNKLIAEETCGGHDDFGHTETTETLFKTDFKSNFKYKVSDFSAAETFACDYFEIKDGKLILYDDELNIVRDWFCLDGRAEAIQDLSDEEKGELNECECILLRASNEDAIGHEKESKQKKIITYDNDMNNMPWSGEDLRELHDRLAHFLPSSRVKFWMTKLAGDKWPNYISNNGYILTQEEINDYNTYDPPTAQDDLFSILGVFCELGTIESELYKQLDETTSTDCLDFAFKLYEEILRTPYMVVG